MSASSLSLTLISFLLGITNIHCKSLCMYSCTLVILALDCWPSHSLCAAWISPRVIKFCIMCQSAASKHGSKSVRNAGTVSLAMTFWFPQGSLGWMARSRWHQCVLVCTSSSVWDSNWLLNAQMLKAVLLLQIVCRCFTLFPIYSTNSFQSSSGLGNEIAIITIRFC